MKIIYSVLLLSIFSACASMKIEKEKVDSVKTVAIVGYAVEQRMPNTAMGLLSGDSEGGMKPHDIAVEAEHATEMYDNLVKLLGEKLKWKVLSRKELVGKTAYQSFLKETSNQPQPRPMSSGPNQKMFHAKQIVETYLVKQRMDFAERQKLIRDLKVDAVVLAQTRVELVTKGFFKTSIAGTLYPQANLHFELFNATQEDPIWMELNAQGEAVDTGESHELGFSNVEGLNKKAILAGDLANVVLISNKEK